MPGREEEFLAKEGRTLLLNLDDPASMVANLGSLAKEIKTERAARLPEMTGTDMTVQDMIDNPAQASRVLNEIARELAESNRRGSPLAQQAEMLKIDAE